MFIETESEIEGIVFSQFTEQPSASAKHRQKLRLSVETFTPQTASEALAFNIKNRRLTSSAVSRYAAAMQRGEWMINGESIIFDWDGRLLQGQHRLHACIKAKIPISSVVVRGVDPKAFSTIDTGKKRSGADALHIDNEISCTTLAAAARAYATLIQGHTFVREYTNVQILNLVEETPELRFWTARYQSSKQARKYMTSGFVAVLTLMAKRHGDEVASRFLADVDTGANLSPGAPALALRERFMENIRRGISTTQIAQLACFIKAANAHINGKPLKFVRFSSNEEMPRMI